MESSESHFLRPHLLKGPEAQAGPRASSRFPGGSLQQVLGDQLSPPDVQGRYCVDKSSRRVYSLQPEPQVLSALTTEDADSYLCTPQGFLVAYRDIPFQSTEVREREAVNYSVYQASPLRLVAQVAGDNSAEPSVSPAGDLLVLPGKPVTLLWPESGLQRQLPCGSRAVFSPDGLRVALCGEGVQLLDCIQDGPLQAHWVGREFVRDRFVGLGQVYLTWGEYLCEFNELYLNKWEHCFRDVDKGCRIRDSQGSLLTTVKSQEGVQWALAVGPQKLFRALADCVELVHAGRVLQRWRTRYPYPLSPSILPLPGSRYVLTADNGGLWVVDDEGNHCFACEPFADSVTRTLEANGDWIAALDYEQNLLLWSAFDGRRVARCKALSGQTLRLTPHFVYACGQLWHLPRPVPTPACSPSRGA